MKHADVWIARKAEVSKLVPSGLKLVQRRKASAVQSREQEIGRRGLAWFTPATQLAQQQADVERGRLHQDTLQYVDRAAHPESPQCASLLEVREAAFTQLAPQFL